MLWLAATVMATATPPTDTQPRVVVEATATVRVISGVRLKLDSPTNLDAPPAHDSIVIANGTQQPARLIEFQ